jgi:hypothetical protein
MPEIDLSEFIPDDDIPPAPPDPLTETMYRALESERGIKVKCESAKEADAIRWQYYNRRKEHRKKRNYHFNSLCFTVVGKDLHIIPQHPKEIEEL